MTTTSFGTKLDLPKKTGAELIALERDRQLNEKDFTLKHDQIVYGMIGNIELTQAANTYVMYAGYQMVNPDFDWSHEDVPMDWLASYNTAWPWAPEDFKPDAKPEENLAKAGALLAAQIDVLTADYTSKED